MKRVQTLFEKYSGTDEYQIHPLPSSGGDRKYFRITWKKGSCIAAIGNETKENETFFYMAGHFRKLGLPVPEILAVSEDLIPEFHSNRHLPHKDLKAELVVILNGING